jgi:hypothetical protein
MWCSTRVTLPSCAVLGCAQYDEAELDRLHAAGIDDPEDDPTVFVESPSGDTPRLWFQRVPESKVVKNRVHLDLTCGDVGVMKALMASVSSLTERKEPRRMAWRVVIPKKISNIRPSMRAVPSPRAAHS